MADDISERLVGLERAVAALTRLVGEQHVEVLQEIKLNIYDIHRNIHLRACQDTAAYVDLRMQGVPRFDDRPQLLEHVAGLAKQLDGDVLEFGVAGGRSLAQFGELLPDRRIFGFDSFEGLPEDWALNIKKGAYAIPAEKMKRVPANATLVVGWFEDSLPKFLETYTGSVALVHIDCDLYSSTATVLRNLAPLLRPGCVIEFDEYMNYGAWRDHEFKAWQELVASRGVRYEYVGYTRRGKPCAVRILEVSGLTTS